MNRVFSGCAAMFVSSTLVMACAGDLKGGASTSSASSSSNGGSGGAGGEGGNGGGNGGGPTKNDYYDFDFTPITTNSTLPSDGRIVLQTNRMRLEMRASTDLSQNSSTNYGGAIVGVWESTDGGNSWSANMINNYDHGRQLPMSLYSGPNHYIPAGYEIGGPGVVAGQPNTAMSYNPLEQGDWAGYPSRILAYGNDGTTYYVKTQMRSFGVTNYETGTICESWTRFVETNVARRWYKISINRAADTNATSENTDRYPGFNQEFPIAYVNDTYRYFSFHDGNNVVTRNLNNSNEYLQGVAMGQNWMAISEGSASGHGFGIHGPDIWTQDCRIDGDPNSPGGETGFTSTYMANSVGRMMDPVGTLYSVVDVIVGTPSDVQSWALSNTASRPNGNIPDYNLAVSRLNFYVQNATTNDDATGGELVVTHQNEQARLLSPSKAFAASDAPNLYVRMKNDSPVTDLQFKYWKPGQTDLDAVLGGQIFKFSVPNDGQYHTVTFTPGWSGLVSRFEIANQVAPENSPVSGRSWKFTYIGTNPPN
jgi:hypothetical protein